MAKRKAPKRTKTKYANIYFNEQSKLYDIKYNYKVYNPHTKKNDYKAKWVYGIATIGQAQSELAKLRANGPKPQDKDITLQGAFELWETKTVVNKGSPITINNTKQQLKMIAQFLPLDTKLKDISEDTYLNLCAQMRKYGYSEETLHTLNGTFRKLINIAYKRRLIHENILNYCDNMNTKQKDSDSYRMISKDEFDLLNAYFRDNKCIRNGTNNYPKYRLLLHLLYYTGARVGELLALTYNDFEDFSYYKKDDPQPPLRIPSSKDLKGEHLRGMRIKITKSYVSDIKLTKDPKNYKKRTIPLPSYVERLATIVIQSQMQVGSLDDRVFSWGHSATYTMLQRACKKVNIPNCSCHDFRHTYISNLIKQGVPLPVIEKVSGDNQTTILKRYSHMFESDEVMVLKAIENF